MSYDMFHREPLIIVGYTTRDHLCLDLDNSSTYKAVHLARLIIENWPIVGDCLLMLSSPGSGKMVLKGNGEGITTETIDRDNYHLIFGNIIGYDKTCDIIECLASCDVINEAYVRIRKMRNDMTLRVSPSILTDKIKPAPSMIAYIGNGKTEKNDGMIEVYLDFKDAVIQFWQSFDRCVHQ